MIWRRYWEVEEHKEGKEVKEYGGQREGYRKKVGDREGEGKADAEHMDGD